MQKLKSHKSFEGTTEFWEHESRTTKTKMKFSVYLPQKSIESCIVWLSGLTCTDENFITKSGVQALLAGTKTMIICPDTSPRGLNLPGEHESYDFGSGAGFYVDATTPGYADHYRMASYVSRDICDMARQHFAAKRLSIMGHSMGGHGALTLGLKNPQTFAAISAFAPIAHPISAPWGQKAFQGYLGSDQNAWKDYDATELLRAGRRHPRPILIDQGKDDEYFAQQLRPNDFLEACHAGDQACDLRLREGYDHSYYFIATFLKEHIRFHLDALQA